MCVSAVVKCQVAPTIGGKSRPSCTSAGDGSGRKLMEGHDSPLWHKAGGGEERERRISDG